jgi:hypothetical protein
MHLQYDIQISALSLRIVLYLMFYVISQKTTIPHYMINQLLNIKVI